MERAQWSREAAMTRKQAHHKREQRRRKREALRLKSLSPRNPEKINRTRYVEYRC
jgi:hypothetical protein